MAQAILSLLNRHPVGLYDNLLEICKALAIDVSSIRPTRAKMQAEIDECIKTFPTFEATVRNMANGMIAQYKQQKTNAGNDSQDPIIISSTQSQDALSNGSQSQEIQSQDLFEDSNDASVM